MKKRVFKLVEIDPLIKHYKLKKTKNKKSIYERLEGAADLYLASDAARTPNREVRDQLTALSHTIDRLTKQWGALSSDAATQLRAAEGSIQHEIYIQSIEYEKNPEVFEQVIPISNGLKFICIPTIDDAHVLIWPDHEQIAQSLEYLKVFTTIAQGDLKSRAPGPRNNYALRMWIRNISSIWKEFRGEPFSVTYYRGLPKSDAARFCAESLQIIDTKITTSKILTEMRKFAADQQKQKSQN
ncbi:MAG: hypothetical protein ACOH12_14795 [Parvibaculaceae bacterium]